MNIMEAIAGRVQRMSHVHRYSTFPVIRRENVAEHSWWVAFISMLIAEDLIANDYPQKIKLGKLLRRALVHDLSEVISGDIIRSYKHTNEAVREAMELADATNMVNLVNDFGEIGGFVLFDYEHAKDDSCVEGEIVAFADMACVAFYVRSEHRLGNRELDIVLKDMYETWFIKYRDHEFLAKYHDQMFPHWDYRDILQWPIELSRIVSDDFKRTAEAPIVPGWTGGHWVGGVPISMQCEKVVYVQPGESVVVEPGVTYQVRTPLWHPDGREE